MSKVYPVLVYDDAKAAIDFLERAFGFERKEAHEDEEGRIVHGELRLGDAVVMVGTRGAGREPFASKPAGEAILYVAVEDTDSHYRRARDAGAEIIYEPVDQEYGSREYAASDPEGNLWSFGSYRP